MARIPTSATLVFISVFFFFCFGFFCIFNAVTIPIEEEEMASRILAKVLYGIFTVVSCVMAIISLCPLRQSIYHKYFAIYELRVDELDNKPNNSVVISEHRSCHCKCFKIFNIRKNVKVEELELDEYPVNRAPTYNAGPTNSPDNVQNVRTVALNSSDCVQNARSASETTSNQANKVDVIQGSSLENEASQSSRNIVVKVMPPQFRQFSDQRHFDDITIEDSS